MNRLLVIFLLPLIILSMVFSPSMVVADQASEVQKQIEDTNKQIKELDTQIAKLEGQIATTSQEKNTLANLIKELTLTRNKLLKEKSQTEKKITATGLVINSLSSDINTKQKSINTGRASLENMIRELYKSDQVSWVEKVLSEESIADVSREYNNTITLNQQVRLHVQELLEEEQALAVSKTNKEAEQKNLKTLKQALTQKEAAINATKKEKDTLLTQTKNKEQAYQKLILENQKKRDAFEAQLASYESKLKFILNPNLLPTAGSGVLAWPLDTVFITQLFGKTVSSKRLYASGSHSGVDFRASVGTPVKSMGNGVVVGTGDTDLYCKGASFGKWVFIKYDNGLSSTFGHLSVISSSAGQKVSTGDIVALSGNTGHSTGPHLHVTVYASQGADVKTVPSISCNGHTYIMPIAPTAAYLDPMDYLPQISKSSVKNTAVKD
jgi:murein DD-endopeptidase MepM/ murein hydrolase activator NlpD